MRPDHLVSRRHQHFPSPHKLVFLVQYFRNGVKKAISDRSPFPKKRKITFGSLNQIYALPKEILFFEVFFPLAHIRPTFFITPHTPPTELSHPHIEHQANPLFPSLPFLETSTYLKHRPSRRSTFRGIFQNPVKA